MGLNPRNTRGKMEFGHSSNRLACSVLASITLCIESTRETNRSFSDHCFSPGLYRRPGSTHTR